MTSTFSHIMHSLRVMLFCCATILAFAPMGEALASSTSNDFTQNNPISDTMCTVVNALTGKTGRAISTLGVIFLGMGLFFGKISWGLAIAIGIGIGGIFGAENIVTWMSGNNTAPGSRCSGT